MATFVHNEPTCLTIIQEAGLPQVFYTAIEVGLEPLVEVIQAVPNALGALCLNETGLQQLASRPSTIPAFFSIFTSERHLKILADKENAVMTGTIIDELVRHHPSLKAQVMASIRSTMSKIEQLCDFFEAPEDQKHWYYLVPSGSSTTVVSTGEDVAMANGEPAATSTAIELMDMTVGDDDKIEENTPPQRSNSIVAFIDILNRVRDFVYIMDIVPNYYIVPRGVLPTSPALPGFHHGYRRARLPGTHHCNARASLRLRQQCLLRLVGTGHPYLGGGKPRGNIGKVVQPRARFLGRDHRVLASMGWFIEVGHIPRVLWYIISRLCVNVN